MEHLSKLEGDRRTVRAWVHPLRAGIILLGLVAPVATAEIIDPTPEDGFKRNSYGLVVKKTPERTTRNKEGDRWFADPNPRVTTWKNGKEWKRESCFAAVGPDRTPDFETARGAASLSFGGSTLLTLQRKDRSGWKQQYEAIATVRPESATWRLDTDTGELTVSHIAARENGPGRTRVRVGKCGQVHCFAEAGSPKAKEDSFFFTWEVYLRKTKLTYDKNQKIVVREIVDYDVSKYRAPKFQRVTKSRPDGKNVSQRHEIVRKEQPAPVRHAIFKYDGDGKIVSREVLPTGGDKEGASQK